MITPFTDDGQLDLVAVDRLVDHYVGQGVDGLFAVCGSSEMFDLSQDERVALATRVVQAAAGRVPVIASGHVSAPLQGQLDELQAMAGTGVDAVVLITSLLAEPTEPDAAVWPGLERLLGRLDPAMPLGLYECPRPYKRLLTPALLRRCADTGRFVFSKDTSCDADAVIAKHRAVAGGPPRVYNANTATLLPTVRAGVGGYCGVMANFHPRLYRWLLDHPRHDRAEEVAQLLTTFALIERQRYPANAKEHLRLEGVLAGTRCRTGSALTPVERSEVAQLRAAAARLLDSLPANAPSPAAPAGVAG
jgi:4-hydroxy-tetrahydrodipicolinate synthase